MLDCPDGCALSCPLCCACFHSSVLHLAAGHPIVALPASTAPADYVSHYLAGLVGLLTLAAQLTHGAAPGLPHLRSLNPYVGSVLNAAAAPNPNSPAAAVAMPRQPCGVTLTGGLQIHGGVSSFAFQGTNAHAVLSAAPFAAKQSIPMQQTGSLLLQQQRYWVLPKAHSLLTHVTCSTSSVVMQCDLAQPSLAFLLHHQVLGRALFPAAGMLEVAAAAATALLHDQSPSNSTVATVTGLAIAAPIVLSDAKSKQLVPGLVLQTSVSSATGALQIGCISASRELVSVNASCTISLGLQSSQGTLSSIRQNSGSAGLSELLSEILRGSDGSDSSDAQTERSRRAGSKAGTGAEAIGEVALPFEAALSGFLIPPQTLDSSLHLGVVAEGSGVRVPIAAKAFTVSSTALVNSTAPYAMHAVAAPQGTFNPNQATTDFSLLGSGTHQVVLSGMMTKILPSAADHASSGAAADTEQLRQLQAMYEVQSDCVSEPIASIVPQLGMRRNSCSLGMLQGGGLLSMKTTNAVDAASAVLQQIHASRIDSQQELHFTTGTASYHMSQSSVEHVMHGVVSGLLRTVATEMSSTAVSLRTCSTPSDSSSAQLALTPAQGQSGSLNTTVAAQSALAQPQLVSSSMQAAQTGLFQLRAQPRGSLENIAPVPFDRASVKLQPLEVLLQVQAVGVNFRDVLNVLGMYPGDPGSPGADCSGQFLCWYLASLFSPSLYCWLHCTLTCTSCMCTMNLSHTDLTDCGPSVILCYRAKADCIVTVHGFNCCLQSFCFLTPKKLLN